MKAREIITAALLMTAVVPWQASAAPSQPADTVTVTRASDVNSGAGWNITLPKSMMGHVQDQVWLVVDGQSEGLGGYDIPGADILKMSRKPLQVRVNITNDLDGQVKDILKAQGLPVKLDVTVYRITYGVNFPNLYSRPKTLHFRHSADVLAFQNTWLPATTHCKLGDRVTVFDAVAMDSAALAMGVFDMNDPRHRLKPGLPLDLVHHIQIQVQFLPVGTDGKLITKLASR